MGFFKEDLEFVKGFVFDIDGVLSLPILEIGNDGICKRTANLKDGYALEYAIKKGYPVAIISCAKSEILKKRFQLLGINDVYLHVEDKFDVLNRWLEKTGLSLSQVMYMGDDIQDYEVMSKVGMPVCPRDAASEIKFISRYVSDVDGGKGCVRDVIEQVLKTQKKWFNQQ